MIVDRDLSKTNLQILRGHDPINYGGAMHPMLLVGTMGVGKSEILKRFCDEQPFILYATVRSLVATKLNSEAPEMPMDRTIDDIGVQFGLPGRSILSTIEACSFTFPTCNFLTAITRPNFLLSQAVCLT